MSQLTVTGTAQDADNLPIWAGGAYFPKFPSTDTVHVFPAPTQLEDIEATLPDWRIHEHENEMMALTLVGMQGVINRSTPEIYFDFQNNLSDASRFWLSYIDEYVEVIEHEIDYQQIWEFLINRYASRFAGLVIYDPDVPQTINLATMIAGLEDRIILAPQQLTLPGLDEFLDVKDLRDLVAEEGWDELGTSNVPIYQWVYDSLWPRLEHRIVGVISPGPPVSGEYTPGHYNTFGLAQREYLVALKLSALFLDGSDPDQAELYARYLSDTHAPVPVTGVSPFEATSVPLIASYGNWMACLSYPGDPITGNLSVLSTVGPEARICVQEINPSRIMATLDAQAIATVFCSDGDNMSYQIHRGFHGGPDWVWEKVQGTPFGWTINPAMQEFSPLIWNYYVDTREEVELISGLSGAGATLIDYMDSTQLADYVERTDDYLASTGIRSIFIHLDKVNYWTDELAEIYYRGLQDSKCLGVFCGKSVNYGYSFCYAGTPMPASALSYTLEANEIENIVSDLVSRNTDSCRFDFGSYPDHRGTVVQDTAASNGIAAIFSVKSDLYREVMKNGPFIQLAPGNYISTFRVKANHNEGNDDRFVITIGRMKYRGTQPEVDYWEELARLTLSPDDFDEADTYQSFQLQFTLERMTNDIEVITSLRTSDFQVTADYFTIEREHPIGFPVFASCIIPLLSADRMTDVPKDFASSFEDAGGLLLTPEEFLTSLNPQFMLDFALNYLNENDPAIIEAREKLEEGFYFQSLISLREALRPYVHVPPGTIYNGTSILKQNYPNPFDLNTEINWYQPESGRVTLTIFSVNGQKIRILVDNYFPQGSQKIVFTPEGLTEGIYLYEIRTCRQREVKKMLYIKNYPDIR